VEATSAAISYIGDTRSDTSATTTPPNGAPTCQGDVEDFVFEGRDCFRLRSMQIWMFSGKGEWREEIWRFGRDSGDLEVEDVQISAYMVRGSTRMDRDYYY
jgi:hypothetical protein